MSDMPVAGGKEPLKTQPIQDAPDKKQYDGSAVNPPVSQTDGFDRQLMFEIRILADFVSSRGDRSLASGSAGKLPEGSATYGQALERFFEIFMQAGTEKLLSADERSFLTAFRDYLADAATPASPSTIAFSTITSDMEKLRAAGKDPWQENQRGDLFDAVSQVFPLYKSLADKFRSQIRMFSWGAVVATVLVALLSGYVYWGNLILAHIQDVQARTVKIAVDRASEEQLLYEREQAKLGDSAPGTLVRSADLTEIAKPAPAHVRDCTVYLATRGEKPSAAIAHKDAANRGVFLLYTSVRYGQICADDDALTLDHIATVGELRAFNSFPRRIVHFTVGWTSALFDLPASTQADDNSTKLNANAIVAWINGYVTPLLMGFIGATVFVLRSYLFSLTAKTLHPRDARAYRVRLALGVVAGLAVGFLMSPGPALSEQTKGFDGAVSLTTPALAFLAGYAAEVLFGFLDSLSRVVFPVTK